MDKIDVYDIVKLYWLYNDFEKDGIIKAMDRIKYFNSGLSDYDLSRIKIKLIHYSETFK